MSRDKIREVIRKFMPPSLERGNTNVSLASQDLLQQRKLNLHEGNKSSSADIDIFMLDIIRISV